MLNKRDLLGKAQSRYTGTFKDDVAFDLLVKTMLSYQIDCQDKAYEFIDGALNIDKSQGKMLDLIGKIIGQSRVLVSYDLTRNFGFLGHPLAQSFGTTEDPTVGGYWRSTSSQSKQFRIMDDATYRIVLRARIQSNIAGGSVDGLLRVVNILTQNDTARVDNDASGEAVLVVEDINLDLLQYFYTRIGTTDSLLPIPLGVFLKVVVV